MLEWFCTACDSVTVWHKTVSRGLRWVFQCEDCDSKMSGTGEIEGQITG